MATHGRHTKIWVDGYELSGRSNGLTLQVEVPSEDVTPFQATGRTYLRLNPAMTLQHNGYLDLLGMEPAIQERLGTDAITHNVAALFGTDIAACPAYVLPGARAQEMQIQAPASSVMSISALWVPGGGTLSGQRGLRILDTTITETGAQTGVDFGTSGSAGGSAYLFVFAVGGSFSGDAEIDIESASTSNFASPTTKGTFEFSDLGSYAISLSGTVGRYVRANVASMGGADSFIVGIVVCVNGVTM